jgi:hypothetical protein
MMFHEMARSDDHHRRGYLPQDLSNRLFDIHEVPVVRSFRRNEGAEQIDGAFKLEGWHYIGEFCWREKLADIPQLHGLLGQVNRSGRQTMGMFLSINRWDAAHRGLENEAADAMRGLVPESPFLRDQT